MNQSRAVLFVSTPGPGRILRVSSWASTGQARPARADSCGCFRLGGRPRIGGLEGKYRCRQTGTLPEESVRGEKFAAEKLQTPA